MQPGQPAGFTDPQTAGAIRPRIRELQGRLVIIVPLMLEIVPNALSVPPGQPQKRITADVIVLDGGPMAYGGRPEAEDNPTPHTLTISTPARFTGMYLSQVGIVGALESAVGKGVVLGRVTRAASRSGGAAGRPPWQLTKLAPDDPARNLAKDFYAAMHAGQWTEPVPTPIAGAPAPSMAASGTYATTMPHTAAGVAIPQGGVPLPPGSPAWQPAAGAIPAVPPAPPGYETMWPILTPEQRTQILASLPASQPALTPPPGFEAIWPTLNAEQMRTIIASQTPVPVPSNAGTADPRF